MPAFPPRPPTPSTPPSGLDAWLIADEPATLLLRAGSDAMIGAGIPPGDVLMVDRGRTAQHGQIGEGRDSRGDGPGGATAQAWRRWRRPARPGASVRQHLARGDVAAEGHGAASANVAALPVAELARRKRFLMHFDARVERRS